MLRFATIVLPAPNIRVCPMAMRYRAGFLSKNSTRGFSLIEIVLALGVIAFALVGIMGLFPVAMKSAQESMRETRATFIAQQIFSDLRTGTGTNRFLLVGAAPTATTPLSLADNSASVVVLFDNNAVATGTNGATTFSNAAPSAAFVANVTVQTNTGVPNLSQVQATIEAPAAAASTNRSRYTFVTLMNY
ncbi:MAG: type IV pilus modification PilV family protein [Terrimicrobiaceae bacterium]